MSEPLAEEVGMDIKWKIAQASNHHLRMTDKYTIGNREKAWTLALLYTQPR